MGAEIKVQYVWWVFSSYGTEGWLCVHMTHDLDECLTALATRVLADPHTTRTLWERTIVGTKVTYVHLRTYLGSDLGGC